MKKVVVNQHGVLHYAAHCEESKCDWDACIFTLETPNEQSVRNAVRKHVLQTGHDVTIESGKSATYELYKPVDMPTN